MYTLEVLTGISQGRCGSFDASEVTIGRGSAVDFRLADDDRNIGRGVHCRLLAPASEAAPRDVVLRNEHRNRVMIQSEELEISLERGDERPFRTPALLRFGETLLSIRSSADPEHTPTRDLLERSWHGDEAAMRELVGQHWDWIRERARHELGEGLRNRVDSMDMAQEAAIRYLKYGPKFLVSEPEKFRALMVPIVRNAIRDENDRWRADKRDYQKDRAVRQDSGISLDPPQRLQERPSQIAIRNEQRELLAMALSLLPEEDRRIVELRDLQEMSFPEIGEALGITEDAARMRHKRALPRLERTMERLLRGEIDESIGE
jgi:RNA polymerase sigma-70 factor (ECF subfamily)